MFLYFGLDAIKALSFIIPVYLLGLFLRIALSLAVRPAFIQALTASCTNLGMMAKLLAACILDVGELYTTSLPVATSPIISEPNNSLRWSGVNTPLPKNDSYSVFISRTLFLICLTPGSRSLRSSDSKRAISVGTLTPANVASFHNLSKFSTNSLTTTLSPSQYFSF